MSNYKNHWTSENKETRINKLDESMIYNIEDVKKNRNIIWKEIYYY